MIKFLKIKKSVKKEHLRGKHHLMFVLLCSFFIGCLLNGVWTARSAEAAYTIDVPYQQAVPDFLEAITEAAAGVKDEVELEEIWQWHEETQARFPEFLEDLIEIARQLEDNGNEQFIVEKYQAFADKWNTISQLYPGLSELEPVLEPIIDQLLTGLPTLQSTPPENPVGNLYELYVEMSRLNPWFVGSLWDVPLIENAQKRSELFEITRERTVRGYKSIDIISRDTVVSLNGVTVFSELIKDGVLMNRAVLLNGPSMLHETLEKMIEDGGEPQEIEIVQEFVDLINLNIELALQNGIIDDCSYSFIFRKRLNGAKSTCTDINGNELDFNEISKYSPFDHVNQVELTRVDPLAKLTIPAIFTAATTSISKQIEPFFGGAFTGPIVPSLDIPVHVPVPSAIVPVAPVQPVIPPMEAWLLGILTPTYLWSAAGFLRLF
jgi:hypothetical protein